MSRICGEARSGTVNNTPVSAPVAGATARSPPNVPFCSSGTQSPAQAKSGPSIMLSATCQAAIAARNRGTLSIRNSSVSSTLDRISPATIHGRRVPVTSLAQPNTIFPRLAAIAPVKAA